MSSVRVELLSAVSASFTDCSDSAMLAFSWSMLAMMIVRTGRRTFGPSWDRTRLDDLTLGLDRHCRRNLHRLPGAIARLRRLPQVSAEFHRRYDVAHGLCGAHHLRELAGIAEATGQTTDRDWPVQMTHLLVEMNTTVAAATAAGKTALPARRLASYRRRYQELIARGWAAHPPPPPTGKRGRPRLGPAGSLVRRLDLYQDDVLRFAADFTVPFDNNQAERDIRMVKLQQKISGGWRSETGADAFLTVRSYLSTARKQQRAAIDVLRDLFTGDPWIPAPA